MNSHDQRYVICQVEKLLPWRRPRSQLSCFLQASEQRRKNKRQYDDYPDTVISTFVLAWRRTYQHKTSVLPKTWKGIQTALTLITASTSTESFSVREPEMRCTNYGSVKSLPWRDFSRQRCKTASKKKKKRKKKLPRSALQGIKSDVEFFSQTFRKQWIVPLAKYQRYSEFQAEFFERNLLDSWYE